MRCYNKDLSQEYRLGCPWELLYADDLVISANSIVELTERLKLWKDNLEEKGLRVNMKKTKIMHSRREASKSTDSSKWPCGVCSKGVGSNSILCSQCNQWIHKRCTNLKGRLRADPDFLCKKCSGELVTSIDNQATSIKVGDDDIEVVQSFCYLGDMISQRGDCFDATTARIRSSWKKFRELLPILTCSGISLCNRGRVYNACVRSVLLYASETWALNVEDTN